MMLTARAQEAVKRMATAASREVRFASWYVRNRFGIGELEDASTGFIASDDRRRIAARCVRHELDLGKVQSLICQFSSQLLQTDL